MIETLASVAGARAGAPLHAPRCRAYAALVEVNPSAGGESPNYRRASAHRSNARRFFHARVSCVGVAVQSTVGGAREPKGSPVACAGLSTAYRSPPCLRAGRWVAQRDYTGLTDMATMTKRRYRYSAEDFREFRTKPMLNIPGLVFTRDGLQFERTDLDDWRTAWDEGVRIGVGLLDAIREARAQGDGIYFEPHLQLLLEPVASPLTARTSGFLRVLERALEVFATEHDIRIEALGVIGLQSVCASLLAPPSSALRQMERCA